mmetsp:Transcript_9069/g.11152  ORF Transcript_9069/g.11152 Transcript_9069/m.11152 type:complete len:203 (-) Transcript_9069:278-886(-)
MTLNFFLTTSLKTACLTQVTLTTISIAHAVQTSGVSPISAKDNNELSLPLTHDIKKTITKMYSGQRLGVGATITGPHSVFSRDAVFEDPVAKCVGAEEISEAFRALRVCCSPVSLSPPRVVGNATMLNGGDGIGCMVVLELRQRYFGWLVVESLVVVEAGQDGLIRRVEERWNGAPLLMMFPFSIMRRGNGLVSYFVTSTFV